MAKPKTLYQCNDCGAQASKWAGQCGDCGAWNSMTEVLAVASSAGRTARFAGYTGEAGTQVQMLSDVKSGAEARVSVGVDELDRVLGGGLVAGSVVLIGGDPGIGKSTLLLQAMAAFADSLKALYVTGEESPEQVSVRARRLGVAADQVRLLAETSVERIIEHARDRNAAGHGD